MINSNKIGTGLQTVDSFLNGGLGNGHLITLTGFCGEGTTSLALTIALNVAVKNNRVIYITLDSTRKKVTLRAISMQAQIPMLELPRRTLTQNQIELINKLNDSNFVVRESSDEEHLITECLKEQNEKTNLIIIDSLNSLGIVYHSYPYLSSEGILKKLKETAGLLNLPILLITRVSHKAYELLFPDQRRSFPDFNLSQLKQHTDLNFVLSKRRSDDADDLAFLKIHGQQKSFALRFNLETNVFNDNNENITIVEESFMDRFLRAQKNSERRMALSKDPTIGTFWESLKES